MKDPLTQKVIDNETTKYRQLSTRLPLSVSLQLELARRHCKINMRQKALTHDIVYFTEISIDTPPQNFPVLVDMSSSDTFVTSADCIHCRPGGVRYDSKASKAFSPNATATEIGHGLSLISANASQDIFSLNELNVENQAFLEAYRVRPVGSS